MLPINTSSSLQTSICQNFPLDILHGPTEEGELGLDNLYTIQGAMHREKFQYHLDAEDITGKFIQSFKFHQRQHSLKQTQGDPYLCYYITNIAISSHRLLDQTPVEICRQTRYYCKIFVIESHLSHRSIEQFNKTKKLTTFQ